MVKSPSGNFPPEPAGATTVSSGDAVTRTQSGHPHPAAATAGRLAPGQQFGPYTIRRLLGAGGMGEVYDCEDLESGRRVALKTLLVSLADPSDRSRFLREGRLAAALSHPHTIYIFGSDEIDGVPVIAMELATGGTLSELVRRRGPLPSAEAVVCLRQIISGLAHAAAAGILHRDIKPANCFVDAAGAVKVGDFGLSVSTIKAETFVTMGVSAMGTPAFASPEQLRGDPLDVRADIYSVGATLYYLLTGQAPFTDDNLMRLLSRVAADPPASVRTLQPSVPEGLGLVVAKCLAKKAGDRFADYDDLDSALQPYSTPLSPSRPVTRVAAFVIDQLVISVGVLAVKVLAAPRVSREMFSDPLDLYATALDVLIGIGYFGWFEGRFGAALGKMAFGLRVTRDSGEAPGVARAMARAAIYMGAIDLGAVLFGLLGRGLGGSTGVVGFLMPVGTVTATLALFGPARRPNGYRALHDRWTGTRVSLALNRRVVATGSSQVAAEPLRVISGRIGPFGLVESSQQLPDGVRLGIDERLRRHVWIRIVAPGAPPVSAARRDLARPTRLRWLGGKRGPADADNWDAYEAPDGEPFFEACRNRQPWSVVRSWLSQLSEELDATALDGAGGALRVDDLWITRSQELKVLDFSDLPAAGTREEQERALILRFAGMALEARTDQRPELPGVPLPLRAREVLGDLLNGRLSGAARSNRLRELVSQPTRVTFSKRVGPLVTVAAPLLFLATIFAIVGLMLARALTPEVADVSRDLALMVRRVEALDAGKASADPNERRDLETMIARRFDDLSRHPRLERNPVLNTRRFAIAERMFKENRLPDDAGLREAEQRLHLLRTEPERFGLRHPPRDSTVLIAAVVWSWSVVGLIAALMAMFFSGGLTLRLADIGLVTSRGAPASRARCLGRALIAWSPVFVAAGVLWGYRAWASSVDPGWATYAVVVVCLGVFFAGAAAALRSPERGWQDRLAGTHLVPR